MTGDNPSFTQQTIMKEIKALPLIALFRKKLAVGSLTDDLEDSL